MFCMKKIIHVLVLCIPVLSFAQVNKTVTGKVFDAVTKEAIKSVTIKDAAGHITTTDATGSFTIVTAGNEIQAACTGYSNITVGVTGKPLAIALQPIVRELTQVVVSANRTTEKRSEAPIAIAVISKQTIEDTKAQRLDMLLNKVSGVNMINLGNEQHEMSIRQPMTTNNLFLYLEDGVPVRTSAVFNHNALLEMNMTAAKSIEVIKGPSSALYGAEAIGGVVNLITQAPPAYTSGFVSAQVNNRGYKRFDAQAGTTAGKLGFIVSGYYANQTNGPIQYSDFHKSAITARMDYKIDNSTTWTNSVTYVDYVSDMYGQLDSMHFAQKNYAAQIFFTYRKVYSLRGKSVLTHQWNNHSTTTATFMYRNNSVIQNPSYQIGSYRVGNVATNPVSADTATGNINTNAFTSYGLYVQHVQKFNFLHGKLIIGSSVELNPQTYDQSFIWVQKQTANGLSNYTGFTRANPDSLLAKYKTFVTDFGSYAAYDFSPLNGLRISTALRYDAFQYVFVNYLQGTKVIGGASAVTHYNKLAPKIGFTYNYKGIGVYGNYSQGYVPPQITDVFKATNNTYLLPQTFTNYEVGGWFSLLANKLYADWSLYLMDGKDEIIPVRQPNGISQSENAGETRHKGVEYGITYRPAGDWSIRLSAFNAKHTFVQYVSAGVNYNGFNMAAAPHFVVNAEVVYKPHYIKGLRAGIEWQRVGKYFMDNLNQHIYDGFNVVNLRLGYERSHYALWVNALNVLNTYYSTIATYAPSSKYAYQLGDPRAITIGASYKFGK